MCVNGFVFCSSHGLPDTGVEAYLPFHPRTSSLRFLSVYPAVLGFSLGARMLAVNIFIYVFFVNVVSHSAFSSIVG